MRFDSTLSPGDKAWTFDGEHIRERTIGQVRIEYTHSPGIGDGFMEGGVISYSGGSDVAENYAPMEPKLVEQYMCVETGIGSGSVYTMGESIFTSEEACRAAFAVRLAELEREKQKRREWQREERIRRLRALRFEIASLKKQVGA